MLIARKLVLILLIMICCVTQAYTQNYSEYLSTARHHLAEGNLERVRTAYSVYCSLSGSRDLSFEDEFIHCSLRL